MTDSSPSLKNRMPGWLLAGFLIFLQCSLLEPDRTAALIVIPKPADPAAGSLAKTGDALSTVQCILFREQNEIYNEKLYYQNGYFIGEIRGLDPTGAYSVYLLGWNSDGKLLGRCEKTGFYLRAGHTRTVVLEWIRFRTYLIKPENNSKLDTHTPFFQWTSIDQAAYYKLQIDTLSSFDPPWIELEVPGDRIEALTTALPMDRYYWRVCPVDELGFAGEWTPTWRFLIL